MKDQKVYIFESGDAFKEKRGLVSINGTIVCTPKYKSLEYWVSDLCFCGESKDYYTYYNLADENAKPIDIPKENLYGGDLRYHENLYHDGLLLVKDPSTRLYGFINWNNELVIPYIYKSSCGFSEGVAFVEREDGTAGFIDTEGNEVLPFKYKKTGTGGIFTGGIAGVSYDGEKMLIIDRQGKEITPADYTKVQSLGNGFLKVFRDVYYKGIASKDGEIIPCDYTNIENYSPHGFKLEKSIFNEEYRQYLPVQGMADFEGNIVIPFEFEEINALISLSGSYVVKKRGGRTGLIWGVIKDGEVVIPCKYDYIFQFWNNDVRFEDCLILEESGLSGVFSNGKIVLPVEYNYICDDQHGMIPAEKDNQWTLFDREGNVIVEAGVYDSFHHCSDIGLSLVTKGNQWGVIDLKGNVVTPLTDDKEWNSIKFCKGHIVKIYKDKKGVITDMKGNVLFEHDNVSSIDTLYDTFTYTCGERYIDGESMGLVKATGEELFPCELSTSFVKGLIDSVIIMKKDSLQGLLDARGNVILPIEFGEVVCVADADIVVAKSGRKWVAFNLAGEPLLKEESKKAKKAKKK